MKRYLVTCLAMVLILSLVVLTKEYRRGVVRLDGDDSYSRIDEDFTGEDNVWAINIIPENTNRDLKLGVTVIYLDPSGDVRKSRINSYVRDGQPEELDGVLIGTITHIRIDLHRCNERARDEIDIKWAMTTEKKEDY